MSDITPQEPRRRPWIFSPNPPQQYQSLPQLDPSRTSTTSIGPRTLGTDFGRYGAATFSSAGAQPLAAVQSLSEASAHALMPPPPPRPPRRVTDQASVPSGQLMPPIPLRPFNRLSVPPHSLMPVIPSRSYPRSSLPKPSVPLRHGTTIRQTHPRVFGPIPTRGTTQEPSSEAVIGGSPTSEPSKSSIPRNEVATGGAANTETAHTDNPPFDNAKCMEILYTRDIEILTEVVENAMYDLACLDEGRPLTDPRYQGMNACQIRTHIHKTIEDGQYKINVLEGDSRILGIHTRPVDQDRFDPRRFGPGPGGYRPREPSSADDMLNTPSDLLLLCDGVGPGYEGNPSGCLLNMENQPQDQAHFRPPSRASESGLSVPGRPVLSPPSIERRNHRLEMMRIHRPS